MITFRVARGDGSRAKRNNYYLGQVSQDTVKLLSLMASAFFICQPFNY